MKKRKEAAVLTPDDKGVEGLQEAHRDADEVEALVGAAHNLLNRALDIFCRRCAHRLPDNWMLRAELHRPGRDGASRPAQHLRQVALTESLVAIEVVHTHPVASVDHDALEVRQPILNNEDLEKIRHIDSCVNTFRSITLDMCYPVSEGAGGMKSAVVVKFVFCYLVFSFLSFFHSSMNCKNHPGKKNQDTGFLVYSRSVAKGSVQLP